MLNKPSSWSLDGWQPAPPVQRFLQPAVPDRAPDFNCILPCGQVLSAVQPITVSAVSPPDGLTISKASSRVSLIET